jgi:hypothetical protein
MSQIKYTVKIRRGLALVWRLAYADSATRNMLRDKFTPDEEADFNAAGGWIDQETGEGNPVADKPVEPGESS